MSREDRQRAVLIAVGSIALALFVLAPFAWMVAVSVSDRPDLLARGEARPTLEHYREIIGNESLHIRRYLTNSLVVAGVTALAVAVAAGLAGYAVSRLRFPGRFAIPLTVLGLSMFPQISIVGYLYRLFSHLGWINTYAALILPYVALTVPLGLWVNLSYFTRIPRDLDRAAFVDGTGPAGAFFRVILPVALPGVLASTLLVFIQCFNEFLFAILLTIDHHAQTFPVGLALFEGAHGELPWGTMMAASVLGSLPLLLLALVGQRHIVSGLAGGAVKG